MPSLEQCTCCGAANGKHYPSCDPEKLFAKRKGEVAMSTEAQVIAALENLENRGAAVEALLDRCDIDELKYAAFSDKKGGSNGNQ